MVVDGFPSQSDVVRVKLELEPLYLENQSDRQSQWQGKEGMDALNRTAAFDCVTRSSDLPVLLITPILDTYDTKSLPIVFIWALLFSNGQMWHVKGVCGRFENQVKEKSKQIRSQKYEK